MKKLLIVLSLLTLIGCTSKTEYGDCVGIVQKQDPKKEYNLSGMNIGLGVIFSEFLIPPILVLVNETYCPVGVK